MFGQHRHHAVYQIHRCGAAQGFVVKGRMGLHVMTHIGNMHARFKIAVGQGAQREGIVKIFGIHRVYGHSGYAPEVPALGQFALYAAVCGKGCLFYVGVKPVWQPIFLQNGVHLGVVFARFAQNVGNLAHEGLPAVRPFNDPCHHLVARERAVQAACGNGNVLGKMAAVGDYVKALPVGV